MSLFWACSSHSTPRAPEICLWWSLSSKGTHASCMPGKHYHTPRHPPPQQAVALNTDCRETRPWKPWHGLIWLPGLSAPGILVLLGLASPGGNTQGQTAPGAGSALWPYQLSDTTKHGGGIILVCRWQLSFREFLLSPQCSRSILWGPLNTSHGYLLSNVF